MGQYKSKYESAVKSFQVERNKVIRLERQLDVVNKSKAWRSVKLYWRFNREFIKGSNRDKLNFIKQAWRKILIGKKAGIYVPSVMIPKDNTEGETAFEKQLDNYLQFVSDHKSDEIIFMFSGTTFIQELKGNRPIRLTKVLLEKGIPVVFSYWRWKDTEPIPSKISDLLFQSPIDLTIKHLNKIINYDFKGKRKIFIVSFPHFSATRFVNLCNINGWTTIYDVRDEWEEFHKVGQAKWFDPNIEKYIVNNCDIVCTVSGPLQEKMQRFTDKLKVQLSPNALDVNFLENSKPEYIAPRDLKPVIGYVGHLTKAWFDWDSLIQVAKLEPNWRFEIIGHSIPSELRLPANIKYLGPKGHAEIKKISKNWRAAIIPFRIGKLSDGVDPIKVYEYLALGLPTVSFRMPQIHDYPYVFIANNVEEFREQTKCALSEPMDYRIITEFLSKNRWEDRVDQILNWGKEYQNKESVLKLIKSESLKSSGGKI